VTDEHHGRRPHPAWKPRNLEERVHLVGIALLGAALVVDKFSRDKFLFRRRTELEYRRLLQAIEPHGAAIATVGAIFLGGSRQVVEVAAALGEGSSAPRA
jgi:hypothetical protein